MEAPSIPSSCLPLVALSGEASDLSSKAACAKHGWGRPLLEELLEKLGVTFSDIKPSGLVRPVALGEVAILGQAPSSNEPTTSSEPVKDGQKVRSIASDDPFKINPQELVLGVLLAVGSAGKIYYGTYGNQEVAVKVFKRTPSSDGHPSFQREVSFLSQLNHPNIVKFLGAYDEPPLQLHITEYLTQGSLRDFLERVPPDEPVPLAQRLRMGRDIACGLGYLHSLGILHCDCKSDNMLIAADGTVKLTDFGIARLEGKPGSTTGETGTYRYLAPEVIGHRLNDRSADAYSFGLVLWETLSGRLPFAGLNAVQAAFAVVHKHRRPEIPPTWPVSVKALVRACWHRNPCKRPKIADVVASLDAALKELEAPGFGNRRRKIGCWNAFFRQSSK